MTIRQDRLWNEPPDPGRDVLPGAWEIPAREQLSRLSGVLQEQRTIRFLGGTFLFLGGTSVVTDPP